jgi:hypothetical protein
VATDPVKAFEILGIYTLFLVDSKTYYLEGINLIPDHTLSRFKNLTKTTIDAPSIGNKYEVFPFDVGKFLIRKAKLVVMDNLDSALDVYPDFKKARAALRNLELAINEDSDSFNR